MKDYKVGLVLSGGGGKGAYQIGVFKALKELGIYDFITGVSGTSVGAINSALFVDGDFDKAESIWQSVTQRDFFDFNIIKFLEEIRKKTKVIYSPVVSILGKYQQPIGIFQQDKIEKLIYDNINFNDEDICKYDIFTAVSTRAHKDVVYENWLDKPKEVIIKYILASAALPVIYKPQYRMKRSDNYLYALCNDYEILSDGGTVDNTPIKPLYDIGYRTFIVVYLNREEKLAELIDGQNKQFKDATFIRIIPDDKFDDSLITGTLNVNKDKSEKLMREGYHRTEFVFKYLQNLFPIRY